MRSHNELHDSRWQPHNGHVPHRAAVLLVMAGVLLGTPVDAQTPPDPPGPYVFDLRGATSGLPGDTGFLPTIPEGTRIPSRGFGFDVGAHIYPFELGSARVGFGLSMMRVRGTASTTVLTTPTTSQSATTVAPAPPDMVSLFTTVAPQVSFNFGTVDGWSYLSAGLGVGSIEATATPTAPATQVATGPETRSSGTIRSINYGAGARWFLMRHIAVGFDIRFHRLSSGRDQSAGIVTAGGTLFSASIGISVR